ncbi:uncharacterized protein LOC134242594 [Saccostrea cucullata]|uniref:uncharacterized protein LOC134242594 n=1 Tax=Saccostrea cuccullata TaxID=36930 RepID=UPI002ED2FBA5
MHNRFVVAVFYVLGTASAVDRCLPGESCFPDNPVVVNFGDTLEGELLLPYMPEYAQNVITRDMVWTKFPIGIVVAKSTLDVQKAVLFARKYNVLVSIRSSGHDFLGRSTAHGSLQILLGNMTETSINLTSSRNPAGEITCESGNTWLKVYEEVDKVNRVIVGGSAHTVCMGGYTLGGGHSPMSRTFGLAVDNLLEVEMVDAEGRIIVANEHMTQIKYLNDSITKSDNNDIFWALRGGGGGTYGIVTKFTFKLHYPASGVVTFGCSYPIVRNDKTEIGHIVLKKIVSMLKNMPTEWGGYLIAFGTFNSDLSWGTISLAMNHYGSYDAPTRSYMDELKNFHPEWQRGCDYQRMNTFLEYESTPKDPPYLSTFLLNTLMQMDSFTDDWIRYMLTALGTKLPQPGFLSFTGILLGGKTSAVGIHNTSVHPGFRSAVMSLSMGITPITQNTTGLREKAAEMAPSLATYGNGQYPNEANADLNNWKEEFWGSNYNRLLRIKHYWDPDNFFTCRECVGSDEMPVPSHGQGSKSEAHSVFGK